MSYLERSKDQYLEVVTLIDRKIAKGKGIKSLRKTLLKKVNELEYLIEHK
tara:strand:- start:136 stop:285 length:150 start_codon:yes stop_codon:yes gene_type:complete